MNFNRGLLLGMVLVVMTSAVAPVFAQKKAAEPIKVFVFAAASGSGFRDPLTDSARDIEHMLYDKNKTIELSTAEQADVQIEVLERRGEPLSITMVFVRLTAGNYSLDLSGHDSSDFASWSGAAAEVARQIQKWIKGNHDRLVAQRAQK